jgi:DNA topoisomerase-3
MSNKAGVPVEKEARQVSELHKCKACGKGLSRRPGTKRPGQKVATAWWGCSGFPECKQTYPDLKGQPDYNKRKE